MQALHAYTFPSLNTAWIFFAPRSPLCGELHREFSCVAEGFGNEVAGHASDLNLLCCLQMILCQSAGSILKLSCAA